MPLTFDLPPREALVKDPLGPSWARLTSRLKEVGGLEGPARLSVIIMCPPKGKGGVRVAALLRTRGSLFQILWSVSSYSSLRAQTASPLNKFCLFSFKKLCIYF